MVLCSREASAELLAGGETHLSTRAMLEPLEPRLLFTAATGIDWTMPARFGDEVDAYGKPVFYLTQEYARQQEFQVDLRLLRDSGGAALTSASWAIEPLDIEWDEPFDTLHKVGLTPRVFLPEGDYEVTSVVTDASGDNETLTQIVVVEDHLIVSLGDSYGSGQGNPHKEAVSVISSNPFGGSRSTVVEEPVWAQVIEDDDDGLLGGPNEGILDLDGFQMSHAAGNCVICPQTPPPPRLPSGSKTPTRVRALRFCSWRLTAL